MQASPASAKTRIAAKMETRVVAQPAAAPWLSPDREVRRGRATKVIPGRYCPVSRDTGRSRSPIKRPVGSLGLEARSPGSTSDSELTYSRLAGRLICFPLAGCFDFSVPSRPPEQTRRRFFPKSAAPSRASPRLSRRSSSLLRRHSVAATPLIQVGLAHPVADRLRRRLKLPRQLLRPPPRANQLHHPPPKLRPVGRVAPRHRVLLLSQVKKYPRNRGTPVLTPEAGDAATTSSRSVSSSSSTFPRAGETAPPARFQS